MNQQYDLLMAGNFEKLLKQTGRFDNTQQNGLLVCDSVMCICVGAFDMSPKTAK